MKLWIGRHSVAGPTATDPTSERARSLTPEGRAIAKAIGKAIKDSDDQPRVIFCSPYQRAIETADIYGSILGIRVNEVGDLSPDRPLSPALKNLIGVGGDETMKRVMLVGHVDNTSPLMNEIDGATWKDLVMGEVRLVEIDRDSFEWTIEWAVKPSDLGLKDYMSIGGKGGVTGRNASDTVWEQLSHDFPRAAIKWVVSDKAEWRGPVLVPLSDIDFSQVNQWSASKEPEKVSKFVGHIKKGRMKPMVGAIGPGDTKIQVLDGHHRGLGYRELGQPALMYVATVADAITMADARAMHSSQHENPSLMSHAEHYQLLLADFDIGTADVHTPGGAGALKPMADSKTPNDAKRAAKRAKQQLPLPSPATATVRPKRKMTRVSAKFGKGGSVYVRSLSEWAPSVMLDGASASDGPVWIQLAKAGDFRGHRQGAFAMTSGTFAEILRNFKATSNQRVPIDYEHASEQNPTTGSIPYGGAPAQGWIIDMSIRGSELWGLVEWNGQARQQIRAKEYMFFSPAIRFDAKDRVTGKSIGAVMTSGALTNKPFLDGMAPLAARDDAPDLDTLDVTIDDAGNVEALTLGGEDLDIIEQADVPPDSSPNLSDSPECSPLPATENTGADPMAMSEAEKAHLDTVTADRDTFKTQVTELTAQLSAATAEVTKLTDQVKTMGDAETARSMKEMNERVAYTLKTHGDKCKTMGNDDEARTKLLSELYVGSRASFEALYPIASAPPATALPRPVLVVDNQRRELTSAIPLVGTERRDDPATVISAQDLAKEDMGQTVTRLMNEGDPTDPQHKPLNYQRAQARATQMRRAAGLPV